jgi:hypothetical protein
MARSRGLAVFPLLVVAATSQAQTNEQLALPSWPEEVWGETVDGLMVQDGGHLKDEPYIGFVLRGRF